jgi:immune inhibitor A
LDFNDKCRNSRYDADIVKKRTVMNLKMLKKSLSTQRFSLIFLLCLLLAAPLSAEPESDNPTVIALREAVIPPRDRIDLAQRLMGVHDIPAPPSSAPLRKPGEVQPFWVTNSSENRAFQVDAALRARGKHIYLWVENGVTIDDNSLQVLTQQFDNAIYDAVRDLWGSENTPGIDGDPRVYGLFAYGMGSDVAAYYSSEHAYPREAVSTSNEHEMFLFNLDTLGADFDPVYLASVVAHEFQHMIRQNVDENENTWLDEGFSTFTEAYLGYEEDASGTALSFIYNPDTQLNSWSENGPRLPHYGAALMFVTYFYERYGVDALRTLSADPVDSLDSVDNALRGMDEAGVNEFFADWVLANYLLEPDGLYGYKMLTALVSPPPEEVVTNYPYTLDDEANQYSTDYFVLTNLENRSELSISIDAPDIVQLVPTTATSGQKMWYSNRADESDTTLTRTFDLSDVTQATLNYRVWYHLENLWDYGYVMVSSDNGATWEILSTPRMTIENPHNNAYGPGYTGHNDSWLDESISLDAYTGQTIEVRFEMMTDDAISQPGMVIDDVNVPQIGYFSDFEADDGGWQAAGWIRTDNTLPQNVWVQAVQQIGTDSIVTRWLAPIEREWSLPLEENVDQVLLAISPFAPLTTVPMPYTLSVTAQ